MILKYDRDQMRDYYIKTMDYNPTTVLDLELQEMTLDAYNTYFIDNQDKFEITNLDILESEYNKHIENINFLNEIKKRANHYFKVMPKYISEYLISLTNDLGKDLYFDFNPLEYKKQNISNKYLMNSSYELYNSLGSIYTNTLNYIFNNNLIEVTKTYEDSTQDYTFFDFVNTIPYIKVNNDNTIKTEYIFNHELCHSIEFLNNPEFIKNYNLNIISEVKSMFISLLTSYKKINNIEQKNAFHNQIENIKDDVITFSLINDISNLENPKYNDFKYILNNKYNDYKTPVSNYIDDIFSTDFISVCRYLYSGIISLYLLDEYQKDEDKGIYLFNKAMLNQNYDKRKYLTDIGFDYKDPEYGKHLIRKFNK